MLDRKTTKSWAMVLHLPISQQQYLTNAQLELRPVLSRERGNVVVQVDDLECSCTNDTRITDRQTSRQGILLTPNNQLQKGSA